MIRSLFAAVALSCALALGGCMTAQPLLSPAAVDVLPPPRPVTRADAAVARASEQLARYCGLTRAAVAAVGFFASPKVQSAVGYASAVLGSACDAPPTDVRTAIDSVGRAYTAVVTAAAE